MPAAQRKNKTTTLRPANGIGLRPYAQEPVIPDGMSDERLMAQADALSRIFDRHFAKRELERRNRWAKHARVGATGSVSGRAYTVNERGTGYAVVMFADNGETKIVPAPVPFACASRA